MQVQTGAALQPASRALDRRRHRRVPLALLGRYMLASRHEYPCQSVDMSPGGLALVAPVQGLIGERIVVYLESIGRLEGQIVRHTEHGLALSITATVRKRDKLASQLTWLANRQSLGLPEDRRHERIAPRHTAVKVTVDQRHEFTGRLVDVSLSGAALTTELRPEIGSSVTVGRTPARVVRRFDGGIAVEFLLPLSPDRFDENIVL
jgi:c-di-GMP-binding flagellar brake protein YcgR